MGLYKLQFSCLFIIISILITYLIDHKRIGLHNHSKVFDMLIVTSIIYMASDIASVYTVNNMRDSILNYFVHFVFFVSIETILFLTFTYILKITGFKINSKKLKIPYYGSYFVSIAAIASFMYELRFVEGKETFYSMGISADICFAMAFIYLFVAGIISIKRWKNIEENKRAVIFTSLGTLLVVIIFQIIFPEALVTSLIVLVIILTIYLNIENFATVELDKIHNNIVYSFADVIESRDQSTGEHIKRTTAYVNIILHELKKNPKYVELLTKDYCENMLRAAPLHDIGKIAVPDAILQKPGKLTSEEFDKMKTHTTKGAELIKNSLKMVGDTQYLTIAYNVALYHHEKFNGNGYPSRLSKEEIPLCARIMAVADVFDAVSQNRCYREAMSLDDSFKIIEDGKGTDFDPNVVEAFLNGKDKVINVYNKFVVEEKQ